MDDKHRKVLIEVRDRLVQDMDPNEVLLNMGDSQVLSANDEEEIMSKKTRRERCMALLEILPRRGEKAYDSFKKALRNGCQKFLWDLLIQTGK